LDGLPWPPTRGPLRTEVAPPHLDHGRRCVLGLHARDHAQAGKARNVGLVRQLDVLDPMPPTWRRALERIQRLADRRVADGVDLDLPSTSVGGVHGLAKLVRSPDRIAALIRAGVR